MAKGKRLSDPEALCIIEAKLGSGQLLTEADRSVLKCLARLDLIRLIEGHYGETLKTSTKNSVRRLVEHVLGPDLDQDGTLASAPSSSPEAEGVMDRLVQTSADGCAAALCVHGLTAEGLAALSGAELPGLPELLGLAAPAGLDLLLPTALAPALSVAAPVPAAAPTAAAAAAAVAEAAPAPAKRQAVARHNALVQPLVLQQVKEDPCQHIPVQMSAEHLQPLQAMHQQQPQQSQQQGQQRPCSSLMGSRTTSTAAEFSLQNAWSGSLDLDMHSASAAAMFDGSSFEPKLTSLDEHCADQLGSSFPLQTCSSLSADILTNMAALTDEMMQLQHQQHFPHHHTYHTPHTQQQQLLPNSVSSSRMAGLGLPHGLGLSHGGFCDPSGFCLEQLLSDPVLHDPSNSNTSFTGNCAPSSTRTLTLDCGPICTTGGHRGLWGKTPAAPPPTPAAAAAAAGASALARMTCRKRSREDLNINSQPTGSCACMFTASSMSQSRHGSSNSSDTCVASYAALYAPPDCDADASLAMTLGEALEALYGRSDADTL